MTPSGKVDKRVERGNIFVFWVHNLCFVAPVRVLNILRVGFADDGGIIDNFYPLWLSEH
jgi:hypothetical protein